MNSSNSEAYSHDRSNKQQDITKYQNKKYKPFVCPCKRSYGSYPALYSHIKRKHDGKAPGQVIKPKPLRRRGRPFKYQPSKLMAQNPHKNASKHLSQYMANVSKHDYQQFPLKQFAYEDKSKQFLYREAEEQRLNFQNIRPRGGMMFNSSFNSQKERNQNSLEEEENYLNFLKNVQRQKIDRLHQINQLNGHQQQRIQSGKPFNVSQLNTKDFNYPIQMNKAGRQFQSRNMPVFNDNRHFQSEYFSFRDQAEPLDIMYSKPFEIILKKQMEIKFKPIEQGIVEFLQPILKQMIDKEILLNNEKQCDVIALDSDENVSENNNQKVALKPMQQQKQKQKLQKIDQKELQISDLIQNQHFSDILKWLMSPPEEQIHRRNKQNYIQFSFRCAIVEFLDFLNAFLETVQYEQVLLLLIFFCDHILASTGSFQLKPQPQIYQMAIYFNDFLDLYLPKLMSYMQQLKNFYIFTQYRKKASQVLMWMSSWMSMQQYYHNKYYRQMVRWEIEQQNHKNKLYQLNYKSYITEGLNQHKGSYERQSQRNKFAPQNESQQAIEEKIEDEAEIKQIKPDENRNQLNSEEQQKSESDEENSDSQAKIKSSNINFEENQMESKNLKGLSQEKESGSGSKKMQEIKQSNTPKQ